MMNIKKIMNVKKIVCILSFCAFLFCGVAAQASLTSANAIASKTLLLGSTNNSVSIRWVVNTSPGHIGAVQSPNAVISGPAPAVNKGALFSKVNAGPHTFTEVINFSASEVSSWLNQGLTRVTLKRDFGDPGGIINEASASVVLTLSKSSLAASRVGSAELLIQRLRIGLDEKYSAVKIIDIDEALKPWLTVNYAGTGLLEGKWQVAEPGSTEGKPFYRTISIVRQPLVKTQESKLAGPVLPTHRAGKYLLRFCLAPSGQEVLSGGSNECPIPAQTLVTAYQVLERQKQIDEMAIESPKQQTVNNQTPFSWEGIVGSGMYKLDIFQQQGEQQWFVTGILLPADKQETTLSQIMQKKLIAGGFYSWQISAVDSNGKLVAQSKQAVFAYQPN